MVKGTITVFVNSGLGRIAQLHRIVSDSPDIKIKDQLITFPVVSTTKAEKVVVEWQATVARSEPTLLSIYFLGTYNDIRVAHPYKILLTVV
jgi:hypothetical protein